MKTDEEKYIEHWTGTLGLAGAQASWREKVKIESQPKRKTPMIFMGMDVCYDSPIDGRHITSRAARQEDLARSGCIEYDPEMKKDAAARRAESESNLEKSVDDHVEREFAAMPIKKKETLFAEIQAGVTVEPVRQTLGA